MSKHAYLVTISEFVVIASDVRDVREWVAEVARDSHQAQQLTTEELARWGKTYPVGSWDPDRELTCAEIAVEMNKQDPR